jgi:hypothetical protein
MREDVCILGPRSGPHDPAWTWKLFPPRFMRFGFITDCTKPDAVVIPMGILAEVYVSDGWILSGLGRTTMPAHDLHIVPDFWRDVFLTGGTVTYLTQQLELSFKKGIPRRSTVTKVSLLDRIWDRLLPTAARPLDSRLFQDHYLARAGLEHLDRLTVQAALPKIESLMDQLSYDPFLHTHARERRDLIPA